MNNRKILASILFFSIVLPAVAQTPPPPMPPPPPGFPIDSGVIALFILALVYGIYKILQSLKHSN